MNWCLNVQGDYVEVKVCDKTCIFFFFPIISKYFLMAKRSLLSRCPSYMYICLYRQLYKHMYIYKGKGLPRQVEVAQGVPGSLRPRIFLTFRHYEGGRSSAQRSAAQRPPLPQEKSPVLTFRG